ncbi:MFS transporter [Microvirga rosea]|uniref:MFS transporter n=1 Tax=Microvirga rosea TaxID=2715425 RepID=UPI001D0BAFCA|nr:MFS transporter [Microvirga rosea]MCB8819063.1 MFS transporter [Microvirga rosea]
MTDHHDVLESLPPASPPPVASKAERPGGFASRPAIIGWLLFDWACQPFFTLVTTFVFAPFFAAALAPDPVTGQSLWGYATACAGLILAVLSPVLGSIADATGPKKPWIAACGGVLFASSFALWFAVPGASYAIPIALVGFGIGTVAVEVAAVFNNAMIPHLVPPERFGRLSGTGWAIGYLGGLVSLLIVLGFLAANGETGRTIIGAAPLFGLDPATREGDRITGPFSALWFLVFILPLFFFTPDIARSSLSVKDAVAKGLAQVRTTIADARRHESVGRFLLANMVYQDALVALFAFGGIYGAGVFGWQATELGIFGIMLTVTGTLGALIGGRLDDRFGAKPVILGAIAVLCLVCLGVLSLGPDHVLFVIATAPAQPDDGLYGSAPEKAFLALGLMIGAVAGPLQASSRSLLARLVPAHEAGRYFGLLALSGKVTSFLAPLMVAIATGLFQTQAAGPAVLILFFLAGGILVAGVKRA